MAKQRSKQPSTSRKTTRATPAPKLLTRPADEAAVEAADEAAVEVEPAVIAPAPVMELVMEPVIAEAPALDHQQIARRAFARFVARGYVHGRHVEDWLAAEAELRAAR
ncbi:MAG: DUF2934 domain-containing protein [Deltaproteobacteria bacterium]|nr:DUF2934 domain-containing protein [Deltaproteobacteria bacterium]